MKRTVKDSTRLFFSHAHRSTWHLCPRRVLKNRFALSTVVTSLIILVISVLLASVVTYFAINVVSTRVQEESLALSKQHVWYNATDRSTQAALLIINTGGRDVVIQKFSVRGQIVNWNSVYYASTAQAVSADLSCNTTIATGSYEVGSVALNILRASDSLTLRSGYSMVLFIDTPDSITINDVGLTVSITLNTAQAMYYVESNVQSTSATVTTTSGGSVSGSGSNGIVTVSQSQVWYVNDFSNGEIALVATNTGGSSITINDLTINGQSNAGLYDAVGSFTVSGNLPFVPTNDLAGGVVVQGHAISWLASPVIPAGETAIIYGKITSGQLISSDVGHLATVSFILASMPTVTTTMLIQNAPP